MHLEPETYHLRPGAYHLPPTSYFLIPCPRRVQTDRAAGFVLAGGASSRMGRDKPLLELEGLPLAVRTARLLEPLVAEASLLGPPERYGNLGLRVLPDDHPGLGPLGGIVTALRASRSEWNLIVACDLPYLTAAWLEYLLGRAQGSRADAVLPESARGLEPLCAMYRKRCHAALAAALGRGARKLTEAVTGLPAGTVEIITEAEWKAFDSRGWLFKNMNTPADYEEARARLEGKQTK